MVKGFGYNWAKLIMLIKTESSVSMSTFHPLLPYFTQFPVINLNPPPNLLWLPNLLQFSEISHPLV